MESYFINKSTLASLNNELVKKMSLHDRSREDKKHILQSLLGNMKKIYGKLDKSKINERNFNKVFDIFSRNSLASTMSEIKPKENTNEFSQSVNVGEMALNRDRELAKSSKVNFMERPKSTFSVKENFYDVNSRNEESNLVKEPSQNYFKSGESSRYNSNLPPDKAMQTLLNERQSLVPDVQRPPTPDFLKETKVGRSREKPQLSNNSNFSSETIDNSRMQGDTYYLSGANLDSNFGSIDFVNNELSSGLPDIDESIDTNRRLEMLQQERNADFSKTDNNNNMPKPDFTKSIEENENMFKEKKKQEMYEYKIQNEQSNLYTKNEQKDSLVDKLNDMKNEDLMSILNNYAKGNTLDNGSNFKKQEVYQPKVSSNSIKTIDTGNEEMNNYLNELSQKQMEQMKQVQILQEQLQETLKNQVLYSNNRQNTQTNYDEEEDTLKNELISKVKILTGQLEQEKKVNLELRTKLDELLSQKEDENDKKLELIENKKEEIRKEILVISSKNSELDKSYKNLLIKENFIKGLIDKNLLLLKSDKYTSLINSKDYNNNTEFIFNLDKELNNVKKLEILSYDMPLSSNNINDSNNKFYFKIFDEEEKNEEKKQSDSDSEQEVYESEEIEYIEVPTGNYDISTLIKKLNKTGKSFDLTFSYNKNTSKVSVKSEKNFSIFRKDDCILNTLGFYGENYHNENNYIGLKSYDLRKYNYVYFFIKNIDESSPVAALNISGNKNGYYYKDLDDLDLSNLDICLKDENNNLIDFCNLSFKIEINLIYSNDDIKIEDNMESSIEESNQLNESII